MKRFRLVFAVILLVASLTLLVWGYWPVEREVRSRPVSPSEMRLPTPEAFHFELIAAA
jgi:hypothetical protein